MLLILAVLAVRNVLDTPSILEVRSVLGASVQTSGSDPFETSDRETDRRNYDYGSGRKKQPGLLGFRQVSGLTREELHTARVQQQTTRRAACALPLIFVDG